MWSWWFETPSRPLWRHCNVSWYVGGTVWCVNESHNLLFIAGLEQSYLTKCALLRFFTSYLKFSDGVVLDCDCFSALAMDLLQCRSIMHILFIYTQVYISQVCVVRSVLMLITKLCCFYVAYIYVYIYIYIYIVTEGFVYGQHYEE